MPTLNYNTKNKTKTKEYSKYVCTRLSHKNIYNIR